MRQAPEFFGEEDLALLYIGKRLKDAQRLEGLLDAAGVDYIVGADQYSGGILFKTMRTGAFFYVLADEAEKARAVLVANGYRPHEED